jgi:hypothetical protein
MSQGCRESIVGVWQESTVGRERVIAVMRLGRNVDVGQGIVVGSQEEGRE